MGYGRVSADGKTFTKATTADGWNTGDLAQVTSPDLSNSGYTAPDLEIGRASCRERVFE